MKMPTTDRFRLVDRGLRGLRFMRVKSAVWLPAGVAARTREGVSRGVFSVLPLTSPKKVFSPLSRLFTKPSSYPPNARRGLLRSNRKKELLVPCTDAVLAATRTVIPRFSARVVDGS